MSPLDNTFIDLYETHYDQVHAFCARRVGWDRADDAVADVFGVVWRRIDEVGPDTGKAWLFAIARGVVLNEWRTTRRKRRLAEKVGAQRLPSPPDPAMVIVRRSEDEVIVRALGQLSSSDQEVLRLAAWEELTGPEIAATLGISVAAAHKRLRRAKKRLARVVGSPPDDERTEEAS